MIGAAVEGVPTAVDILDQLATRTADMGPALDGVYAAFLKIETARFDAEGPGWADLAETTVAEKARKSLHEEILDATGKMRASFTDAGAAGAVFEPVFVGEATTVTMGSDLKPDKPGRGWQDTALAWFHQNGTPRMPARPPLADPADYELAWTVAISEWLSAGVVTIDA